MLTRAVWDKHGFTEMRERSLDQMTASRRSGGRVWSKNLFIAGEGVHGGRVWTG